MAACCHGNCSSDLWTRFASATSMQITSKFIQSNGATPDFHGQERIQSRFSPSEFDIRRWWSLESEKNSLIIAGGGRMKNILQQRYKKKIFLRTWLWGDLTFSDLLLTITNGRLYCSQRSVLLPPCTEQGPYSCFYCENKGGWRTESKSLQKDCGQDQFVLLFAGQVS